MWPKGHILCCDKLYFLVLKYVRGHVAEWLRRGSAKPFTAVRFRPWSQLVFSEEALYNCSYARVAESVDARVLKTLALIGVRVRVSPRVLK